MFMKVSPRFSYFLELGRSKAPASDGKQDLQLGIPSLESCHSLVQTLVSMLKHFGSSSLVNGTEIS
jgi:hypothetical protein